MDYGRLFQQVAQYLRENDYAVVVDQVQEELANGHLNGERIQATKPGDFIRGAEYSDKQALVLLIEAAQRAIVDPSLMVADIAGELSRHGVQFIFEVPEGRELAVPHKRGQRPFPVNRKMRS